MEWRHDFPPDYTIHRETSTYAPAHVRFTVDGFSRLHFQDLARLGGIGLPQGLDGQRRWAIAVAMTDAGHVPPMFEERGHVVAVPPYALLDLVSEEARADYLRVLAVAIDMVADRLGWFGEIGVPDGASTYFEGEPAR